MILFDNDITAGAASNVDLPDSCTFNTKSQYAVIGEKLVISMVATNQYHVFSASEKEIPYAGYFIKVKEGSKAIVKNPLLASS